VANNPQAEAVRAFVTIDLPGHGPIRMLRSPVTFTATAASIGGPAPEHGQHTEEVLLEAGYTWDDIGRLKDEGALG